jgi:feruloyl esterase
MDTRKLLLCSSVAAALIGTAASALAAECSVEGFAGKTPRDTTINSATPVAATDKLAAHCLVKGYVATDGNTVDFQLALPVEWNGKFLFQGVGGFAGSMGRLDAGIVRGYASATTDTGHQGGATDGSWALNNRPKEIDYGYRGTHVTTDAAKKITAAFYGAALKRAYFSGCSNGGRQALMEAQRFPEDYDGIIAGDPSFGALGYLRRGLTYQYMLSSADHTLTPEKLEMVSKAVTAACDASDGLVDGLVSEPRRCTFKPQSLACKGAEQADCLTAGQVGTLEKNYADMKLPNGVVLVGYPKGHEAGATGWPAWITGSKPPTPGANGFLSFGDAAPAGFRFADGYFRYMAFEKDDPNYDWLKEFDVKHDLARTETVAQILSPTDANLSKLQQHGAKLLLYHGWADPAIPAFGTINYYNKVVANAGGKAKADNFVRLFLAPGMHHCGGGPGPNTFDTLTAMEQWAEQGKAPAQLIAEHLTSGKVDRSRPLCPEPQVAQYVGSGSVDEAANFRCAVPKT